MPDLVFLVPDERFPVPVDDVQRVIGELELLERDGAPYDARGAMERLDRAFDLGSAADTVELEEWMREEVHALARALDHLRNTAPHVPGELFAPEEQPLLVLRDAVLSVYPWGTVTYELSPLIPPRERRELRFKSYTGPYGVGDRLVYVFDQAYKVVGSSDSGDHERLLVENFRL